MTDTDISSRSDCFKCGSEAEYTRLSHGTEYLVECCNIDCPVFNCAVVTAEEASASPSDPLAYVGG